jgi:ammonium transporter Rh
VEAGRPGWGVKVCVCRSWLYLHVFCVLCGCVCVCVCVGVCVLWCGVVFLCVSFHFSGVARQTSQFCCLFERSLSNSADIIDESHTFDFLFVHIFSIENMSTTAKTYGSMDVESAGYSKVGTPSHAAAASNRSAAWLLIVVQAVILVLFGMTNLKPSNEVYSGDSFNVGYTMFSGVLIMMFIGFGYLMTFLDTYGLGAVGFTFAVTVIVFEWSLLTENFFTAFFAGQPWITADGFSLSIYDCINSLFAVAAILITFGGVIGKLSLYQLLVLTLIETVFYSFNNHLIVTWYHLVDPGGTVIIHCFGAYFGLAAAYMLKKPETSGAVGKYADMFAFIGTLFLWIYWPSFVGGALEAGSAAQQRATINTILSLAGSTIAAFALSVLLNHESKVRPVDIQNATLAGGVTIGVLASLELSPMVAVLVGIIAGSVSCFGFNVIQPYLEEHFDLHDSCGIHNLHGMPSVLGGLISVIIAIRQGSDQYDPLYAADQWSFQLQALLFTLCCAIVSGACAGVVVKSIESVDIQNNPNAKFLDTVFWEVAPAPGEK